MENVAKYNANPIKYLGFASRSDANNFLLANPDYAIGGVHFQIDNPTLANATLRGFIVQVNTTVSPMDIWAAPGCARSWMSSCSAR